MFLLNWYRDFYKIRAEIRELELSEEREAHVCKSCETLKQMNDYLRMDNEKLMRRLLDKPESEMNIQAPMISVPKTIPWNVRKQMLEKEDRERARLLRNAPTPEENRKLTDEEVKEFEKELNNATAAREAEDQRNQH